MRNVWNNHLTGVILFHCVEHDDQLWEYNPEFSNIPLDEMEPIVNAFHNGAPYSIIDKTMFIVGYDLRLCYCHNTYNN